MSHRLSLEPPTALEYFSALVADDASLSLLEAAAWRSRRGPPPSLCQDEHPDIDLQGLLGEVDSLADQLRRRVPADAVPLQRLRRLNRYFFQELGFAGHVNDY